MHHFAGTTYSATRHWGKVCVPLAHPLVLEQLRFVPVEWRESSRLFKAATLLLLGKRGVPPALPAQKRSRLEKLSGAAKRFSPRGNRLKGRQLKVFTRMLEADELRSVLQSETLRSADLFRKAPYTRCFQALADRAGLLSIVGALLTIEMAARELGSGFDGVDFSECDGF
jgi:hypothetical protein